MKKRKNNVTKKGKTILPKLRKISKKNKKHHYHLKDPKSKRILAINEGVNYEMKYKNRTKKRAAIAKKARFNVLRIYRRYKNKKACEKITKDMIYMDKKYKLGKTNNICKSKKKNSKKYNLKGGKSNNQKKNKKIINNKDMNKPKKVNGHYYFEDFPNFKPNLSPREIFRMGSFGGTYWRPIFSRVLNKDFKNIHKKYPKSWWKNIPKNNLTRSYENYDVNINKYKVKVGTTLEFWENKEWIKETHPYGWVHWYCDFFMGKRCDDDKRQISRWEKLAGPKGRFMKYLVTLILKKYKNTKNLKTNAWKDENISPKIRQVLQHWAYKLTKKDFNNELKKRNII